MSKRNPLSLSLILLCLFRFAPAAVAFDFSGSSSLGSYSGTASFDGTLVTITCQVEPAATNILIYPEPPGGGYYMSAGDGLFTQTIAGLSAGTLLDFYFVIQNPTQWPAGQTHSWVISQEPAGVIYGDVNGDGNVTIVDGLMTAQYYVGLDPAPFSATAADVDLDGSVSIIDALIIAQYYVGLLQTLPVGSAPTSQPTRVPTNPPTPPSSGENLLANGDFSAGLNGWELYLGTGGAGELAVENGELFCDITAGGSDAYSFQVMQTGLNILNGRHYRVSFRAHAQTARELQSQVCMSADPWASYSGAQFLSLTPAWQQFSYSFTMQEASDPAARIVFDCGVNDSAVYLDDIGLSEVAVVPTSPPTAAPTPGSGAYQLVWSDEFDSSAIDTSHWQFETGGSGWGNNELEYYTSRAENARIENGNLLIEARREEYYGSSYTSARMITASRFEFTYGKVEARIRVPVGQGLWPAFWMLGNDIGTVDWPACGEIDIMEHIGSDPAVIHGSLHGPGYSGNTPITRSYSLPGGQWFSDDFHIFSVEWGQDSMRWFVDGLEYYAITAADLPGEWVYDHPCYILLNVAVGGDWPGSPDATTQFPQRMYIDYVRVYQR